VLYVTLPDRFTLGPGWLFPVLELAMLVPLASSAPTRHAQETKFHRIGSIALIAVVSLANVVSLVLLVIGLLEGAQTGGTPLVFAAMQIWVTNVLVFGLWYWELDRGGPAARCRADHREPDFLFPQMATPAAAPASWSPRFLDYLYLAFTNATAFSPTDTLPLTLWAKALMLVQSVASLLTVVFVAARAVNILQ
jgi:uncharacterized membrane protein